MWLLWCGWMSLAFAATDPIEQVHALQRQGQYVAAQEILDDLVLEHNTPAIGEWAQIRAARAI